jgi:zinc finger protein
VEELDLEVEPGIAADGYVSNVEGVLNRFISAIEMLQRQASQDDDESCYADCQVYIDALNAAIAGEESELTLVLLDPLGNSKILHEEARNSSLSEREVEGLSVGPTMPIFDASDLGL